MTLICLFCGQDPLVGSDEHVFLSALGGRVVTRNAICQPCNNHFSQASGDRIDVAVADSLKVVRCGLMIWSGRGAPPPTIERAGTSPSGVAYDLAPGFVPLTRRAEIPNVGPGTQQVRVNAATVDDAKRVVDIIEKRGGQVSGVEGSAASEKVGTTTLNLAFDGPRFMRSVAKTAVTACCLLYGNQAAASTVEAPVRQSVYTGDPPISRFGWWDYSNPWPLSLNLRPHARTPQAKPSHFDHSVVLCDVGAHFVAYITLFGAFRFSVRLGSRSGVEARAVVFNPRVAGRLHADVSPPATWRVTDNTGDFDFAVNGLTQGLGMIMATWQRESESQYAAQLSNDLGVAVLAAGDEHGARERAIDEWSRRVATLELGGTWETALDSNVFDD